MGPILDARSSLFSESIAYGKAETVAEGRNAHSRSSLIGRFVLIRGPGSDALSKELDSSSFR